MPCNIGFKSYSRVKIPVPQPQNFKSKIETPKIDAELLAKIGEGDFEFIEWLQELDIVPLLKEALKRALLKIDKSDLVSFSIKSNGYLEANASYNGSIQKKKIETITNLVFSKFQLHILSIILELLDYEISISDKGRDSFVLEGEKKEEKSVHKYVKITKTSEGEANLCFEHFESLESLAQEREKLLALSQKFGIKLIFSETKERGQPIPEGTVHQHFLEEKQEKN
ncbi:MAG: hypothetical protein PHE59_01865 [Patescibacteria group bacterium]|nr:hypothetical protein [Patescibacteria group bacterium]MDD5164092.1 hypothetical protein [Patescibacteria group bacterium]MDD5534250.1 hypothetical protein [Patescibacteria group bacterium]